MSRDAGKLENNSADHRLWSARVAAWAYRIVVVGLMSGAMIVWGLFLWWLIGRFLW
jgi:hypothetical protein